MLYVSKVVMASKVLTLNLACTQLLGISELEICHGTILCTLIELSKNTSLFPEQLVQYSVHVPSSFPITGGSFGSVYMGNLYGQTVAVKLLRLAQNATACHSDTALNPSIYYAAWCV